MQALAEQSLMHGCHVLKVVLYPNQATFGMYRRRDRPHVRVFFPKVSNTLVDRISLTDVSLAVTFLKRAFCFKTWLEDVYPM